MKKRIIETRAMRGFTLVEILVVIGVITLLAGIAFPVFSRVREAGRRNVCSSNLKQLGLAFNQYLQDNGGRFPGAASYRHWHGGAQWVAGQDNYRIGNFDATPEMMKGDFTSGETGGCTTDCNTADVEHGAIYPYVRTPDVYYCPSVQFGREKRLSYSMNCALQGLGEIRIRQPQDIILLVDEDAGNDGYFFAGDTRASSGLTFIDGGNSTDTLTSKHNGGGNLLFADGHVKSFLSSNYLIDKSDDGKINKGKMDGSPRFHDKAFGQYGSNDYPGIAPDPVKGKSDSCGVVLSPAPPTTP